MRFSMTVRPQSYLVPRKPFSLCKEFQSIVRLVVLKLKQVSELSGGLVKHRLLGPAHQSFRLSRSEMGSEIVNF